MHPDEFRIVIVANGCTDDTAARARAAAPGAMVIETPRPGKAHALNLGRMAAPAGAVLICLDADLEVTAEALRALIAPLRRGEALAACGRMDVMTDLSSAVVRAFYRGWRLNPYFGRGKFGGLFALAPDGAARVFPLPPVTADDEFVRRSFAAPEIAFVPDCVFTARAPRTLASLLRVRRRSLRGARAISRLGKPSPEGASALGMARRVARRPSEFPAFAVFVSVMATVRVALALEARRPGPRWERDLTSRTQD
jgi:cellulose synthase/poly-beta-1,6-N-acetylglucosamine synthase-like glycosyltransferase